MMCEHDQMLLAVAVIGDREMKGRDFRRALHRHGLKLGPIAFYRLMAQLEDRGMIQHRIMFANQPGPLVKTWHYWATIEGKRLGETWCQRRCPCVATAKTV